MHRTSSPATLLLAEDDDDLRGLLAEALRSEGYKVIEARDEREWSAALDRKPHMDLVLADVEMPGRRDGIALANRVHEEHPAVPILLITGKSFDEVTFPPHVGYLAKPFGIGELLRYVESSLRGARP